MHHRSRTRRFTPGAVAVALLLAGCADDSTRGRTGGGARDPAGDGESATATSPEPVATTEVPTPGRAAATTEPMTDDEAVAFGLCSALRAQGNVMTEIANTSAADIHEKSPGARYAALFDGYGRGAAASIAFRDGLAELDLPAIPELDDLIGQVSAGADAAAAEFADEQQRFADDVGGAVGDDDARGRVSELFNSIEKANSLVEPVIVRYERVDLKRAFLDEAECRYVIQQFVLDES